MRKFLCGVLALVICICYIGTYVRAEETENTETTEETPSLQTQREDVQNKINEASDQLEDVKSDLSENLQQIEKLDATIENSQAQLDELNMKMTKLQESVSEVTERLEVAEGNYSRQKELLDKRLIATYEANDTEYLDVLLHSGSISDFLSNYFLITEIMDHEQALLEDMQSKRDEIKLEKEKLDKAQEQLSDMKANQTRTAKILENTKLVRENFISKLSDEEKELQTQIDELNARYAEINREILAEALNGIDSEYIGGELAWPVPGYTRITSPYGMRVHPITKQYKLHTGTDISAPLGSNFIAANDGIVTKATYNVAYGNMVIIDHGGGVSTLYAHGSEILVEVGQTVTRGEAVLKVGSTGYSTGPHAHFEVRLNGVVTDPMPYITNGLVPQTQNKEGE